jgi:tetratricopeptide (TPR) repeat protein
MNTRTAVIGSAAALFLAVAGGAAWTERGLFLHQASAVTQDDTPDNTSDERLPVPPVPQRIASGDDYEHCMGMLASDPAGANAFADAWEATGGGDGATHCHALAQIELGSPAVGADMLETLAQNSKGPALARAAIYGQAGQAWLMASQPDRAFAATTLALAITPDDPDLLIERAIADGQLERFQDAADDLDQALATDPKRADALTYRAAARRHLNQLDAAQTDIDEALTLDPQNPEALLERGIIRERTGNPAGARDDWQSVTTLAPDSPTADLAQQNLALLDAGPERH